METKIFLENENNFFVNISRALDKYKKSSSTKGIMITSEKITIPKGIKSGK